MDSADIQRIRKSTLVDAIYNQIRDLIIMRKLKPGEKLNEQYLARKLGTSRTPIREALLRLQEDGLVTNEPFRGTYVTVFTPRDIQEIYDFRKALEGMAARLALPSITDSQYDSIRQLVESSIRMLELGEIEEYIRTDAHFHDTLVQMSGNRRLIEAMSRIGAQIQVIRALVATKPGRVYQAASEHRAILKALERRDVSETVRLLEEHIDNVKNDVVSFFEKKDLSSPGDYDRRR